MPPSCTNIVEDLINLRLGTVYRKHDELLYRFLKSTPNDIHNEFMHGAESSCPVFVCRFCNLRSDRDLLVAANEDGCIVLHNTLTGHKKTYQAHKNAIFDLCWSKNELKFLTASGDRTAAIWDIGDGGMQNVAYLVGHSKSVKVVTSHPTDNAVFASGGRDGSIIQWDSRCRRSCTVVSPERTIKYSHFPQKVFSTPKSNRKSEFCGHSITGLAYQSDTSLISCSSCEGTIKVWDMRRVYCTKRVPTPVHTIPYTGKSEVRNGFTSLAVSPCGLRLYANCVDNIIYEYNIGTYSSTPVATYYGHRGASFYIHLSLSPDGKHIGCGSTDHLAYVWDVSRPGHPIITLNGHEAEVTTLDWCKSGEVKIASCSDDNTYRLWRVKPDETDAAGTFGRAELCSHPKTVEGRQKRKYRESHIGLVDPEKKSSTSARRVLKISTPVKEKFFSNLPDFVTDGSSPHSPLPRRSPRCKNNWLTEWTKNTPPPQPAERKTPNRSKKSARGNLLRFFKTEPSNDV